MSFMSKIRSAIGDKSEIGSEEIDPEVMATYHQFFIERKQAIIDQWEKDQSELKKANMAAKAKEKPKQADMMGELRISY